MSAESLKVVIPGGTGQVGRIVARALHAQGHEVLVLTRRRGTTGANAPTAGASEPWRTAVWDPRAPGAWCAELEGADVLLNLAGRSVDCRYTRRNRREILDSRVLSTRTLGRALADLSRPPRVWLQASTATIYAHRHDAANDEATGVIGGEEPDAPASWRFSIEVARAWERELDAADTPRTRKLKLRSAMTMSPDRGGIFATLLGLVRHGLGGTCGDGRQYVSWIHERDFVRALLWLIEHEQVAGAVNLAAPEPLPNAEFLRVLRRAFGARIGLPASRWMLELGAFALRTETELILKSRRVVPGRLLAGGFCFEFPSWEEAARELCRRWRGSQ